MIVKVKKAESTFKRLKSNITAIFWRKKNRGLDLMKSHFKMPDVSEKLKLNLIEFKKQIPRAIHLQKKIRQFNYNSSYPTQVNY